MSVLNQQKQHFSKKVFSKNKCKKKALNNTIYEKSKSI